MAIKLTESRLRQIVKEEMSSISKRRALTESQDKGRFLQKLNAIVAEFLEDGGDPAFCSEELGNLADEVFDTESGDLSPLVKNDKKLRQDKVDYEKYVASIGMYNELPHPFASSEDDEDGDDFAKMKRDAQDGARPPSSKFPRY